MRQPARPDQALDESKPLRPYLVVSSDSFNLVESYPRVTLCPLTGAERVSRRYDTDVLLRRKDTGLPKDSVVRCVEVYTLFRELLVDRAGIVPGARMREVERALALYLAMPWVP